MRKLNADKNEKNSVKEKLQKKLEALSALNGKIKFNLSEDIDDSEHDAWVIKNVEDFNKKILKEL